MAEIFLSGGWFGMTVGIELKSHLLYNLYTMATPDEQRKLVALRMLPSAHRQAKIAAVTEGKTLGLWIEEAIREKVERGGSPR